MATEEIIRGIYRIPVPLAGSPLRDLNAYLILDDRRSILIDTGFREEGCREALFSQLKELGLGPGDVDVLLTHMHSDHSGLAAEAAGEQGKIYLSTQDVALLQDSAVGHWTTLAKRFEEEGFHPELINTIRNGNPTFQITTAKEHRYWPLQDGQVLCAGGYRLECLLMSGHTPGHMCFYIRDAKLLFTGDHVLFDISPNITAWPELSDALGTYLENLKRIQQLDVKYALPSHRSSGNLQLRVDQLLRHHERRLAETLQVVKENPGLPAYDLAGKMRWKIRTKSNRWEDFPLTQRWFAVGECMSHLDHLVAEGNIYRENRSSCFGYYAV